MYIEIHVDSLGMNQIIGLIGMFVLLVEIQHNNLIIVIGNSYWILDVLHIFVWHELFK